MDFIKEKIHKYEEKVMEKLNHVADELDNTATHLLFSDHTAINRYLSGIFQTALELERKSELEKVISTHKESLNDSNGSDWEERLENCISELILFKKHHKIICEYFEKLIDKLINEELK